VSKAIVGGRWKSVLIQSLLLPSPLNLAEEDNQYIPLFSSWHLTNHALKEVKCSGIVFSSANDGIATLVWV
jgi:hypothetical protein